MTGRQNTTFSANLHTVKLRELLLPNAMLKNITFFKINKYSYDAFDFLYDAYNFSISIAAAPPPPLHMPAIPFCPGFNE